MTSPKRRVLCRIRSCRRTPNPALWLAFQFEAPSHENRRLRCRETPGLGRHPAFPEGGLRRLRAPPGRVAGDAATHPAGLPGDAQPRRRRPRGLGHGGQGRRRPAARLGARSSQLQGAHDCRADRAREIAALPAALLGTPAAARPNRRVRPVLVRPRAGRARGRLRHAGRMAQGLRRDQRLRAHADRRRHPAGEALPAYHAGGADAAVPQPADRPAEALEAVLRGFPQPDPLEGLRNGDRGHDGEDLDPSRALASHSSQRQAVRPARRLAHHGRLPLHKRFP